MGFGKSRITKNHKSVTKGPLSQLTSTTSQKFGKSTSITSPQLTRGFLIHIDCAEAACSFRQRLAHTGLVDLHEARGAAPRIARETAGTNLMQLRKLVTVAIFDDLYWFLMHLQPLSKAERPPEHSVALLWDWPRRRWRRRFHRQHRKATTPRRGQRTEDRLGGWRIRGPVPGWDLFYPNQRLKVKVRFKWIHCLALFLSSFVVRNLEYHIHNKQKLLSDLWSGSFLDNT